MRNINLYKATEHATNDVNENDIKLLTSVIFYLESYHDTSNSKTVRIENLSKAAELLTYITSDININLPKEESSILQSGFLQILTLVKQAEIEFGNKIFNFRDSIGFLRLLVNIKKG